MRRLCTLLLSWLVVSCARDLTVDRDDAPLTSPPSIITVRAAHRTVLVDVLFSLNHSSSMAYHYDAILDAVTEIAATWMPWVQALRIGVTAPGLPVEPGVLSTFQVHTSTDVLSTYALAVVRSARRDDNEYLALEENYRDSLFLIMDRIDTIETGDFWFHADRAVAFYLSDDDDHSRNSFADTFLHDLRARGATTEDFFFVFAVDGPGIAPSPGDPGCYMFHDAETRRAAYQPILDDADGYFVDFCDQDRYAERFLPAIIHAFQGYQVVPLHGRPLDTLMTVELDIPGQGTHRPACRQELPPDDGYPSPPRPCTPWEPDPDDPNAIRFRRVDLIGTDATILTFEG